MPDERDFRIDSTGDTASATPERSALVVFLLALEKAGRHMVLLTGAGDHRVFDVEVTDALGLTPFWVRLLTGAGPWPVPKAAGFFREWGT